MLFEPKATASLPVTLLLLPMTVLAPAVLLKTLLFPMAILFAASVVTLPIAIAFSPVALAPTPNAKEFFPCAPSLL